MSNMLAENFINALGLTTRIFKNRTGLRQRTRTGSKNATLACSTPSAKPRPQELFARKFDVAGKPFTVLFIGKDGSVKLRKYLPLKADGLFGIIDKMPMRKEQMRQRASYS